MGTSCTQTASSAPWPAGGRLHVAVAVPAAADADAVHLSITRCGTSRPLLERNLTFTATSMADLGAFAHKPLRLAAPHVFARGSWGLRAGCYTIAARVLDRQHRPLARCGRLQTARLPLGPGAQRYQMLVARCGDQPDSVPLIDQRLNFPPVITALRAQPVAGRRHTRRVCVSARDAERDAMQVRWSAHTFDGRVLALPAARTYRRQPGTRVDCVDVVRRAHSITVTAIVVDGVRQPGRGFVSREELRTRRYGITTPSRATRSVRIAPRGVGCHGGRARVASRLTYWIRRHGRLLAPTHTLAGVRPGDEVQVEFDVRGRCGRRRVTLATRAHGAWQTRDTGRFAAGTHVLGVAVPPGTTRLELLVDGAPRTTLDTHGASNVH